jgi:ankyrin repeat protein
MEQLETLVSFTTGSDADQEPPPKPAVMRVKGMRESREWGDTSSIVVETDIDGTRAYLELELAADADFKTANRVVALGSTIFAGNHTCIYNFAKIDEGAWFIRVRAVDSARNATDWVAYDQQIVRHLLAAGGDLNSANRYGATRLWREASKGRTEIVRHLLAAGADVNAPDKTFGATPLFVAAGDGHTEIVQLLLAAKADVNAATTHGATPLFMAAGDGHTEIVQLLLAAKADVNAATTDGATPLLMAAGFGHTEIVQLLLAAKADVNAGMADGATPLSVATHNGHGEIVKLLKDHGGE